MSIRSDQALSRITPAVLLLATGAFWIAILALGAGDFLALVAIASVASGILLIAMPTDRTTDPVVIATCLFGLVLTVYQFYVGLTEIGTILGSVAIYNTVPFAVLVVIYGYILFFSNPKKEE
ncbi:MAG: hypothetical protein OK456_02895 [Thaumarchaeota archaeon]|nr:hypothetical protein [Nitrososphaerota archaeon]